MNKADMYFKDLMGKILTEGTFDENPRPIWLEEDGSRTPAYCKFITHHCMTYDLSKNEFPFITLRPVAWKTGIKELCGWIMQDGSNDIKLLEEKYKVFYWKDWEVRNSGTIGQVYGHTVQRYDLMNKLLNGLKNDPFGRRHILSLWQEQEFIEDEEALKPCCFLTNWSCRKVNNEMYLDMVLVQRSSDFVTAGAINETQYVGLMLMVAKHCGYKVGKFTHWITNAHCYDRHIPLVEKMLKRESISCQPKLILDTDKTNFYDFTIDDFRLIDYPLDEIKKKNPQLKFPLAI